MEYNDAKRYTLTLVFNQQLSQVLLVMHHEQNMFNFIGGHIEDKEDEMDASYRELYEETGITKDDIDLVHVQSEYSWLDMPSNTEWYLYITAGVLKHDVELKEEKNKLYWVSPYNTEIILDKTFGDGNCLVYLRRAIRRLSQSYLINY